MSLQAFLFALLTAFFWGSAAIFDKLALAKLQPLAGVAARSLVITLVAVGAAAFSLRGRAWQGVDARSWVFIILSGLFSGLLGQWTYYKALKYADASRIVPIAGSFPLVAFVMAVLLLGESLTTQRLLGTILVVAGIALLR